jgi:hypothetical protein
MKGARESYFLFWRRNAWIVRCAMHCILKLLPSILGLLTCTLLEFEQGRHLCRGGCRCAPFELG